MPVDVDHLNDINIFARGEYADLVRRYLDCGEELGVKEGADETNGDIGTWMLEALSEDVVERAADTYLWVYEGSYES